ncbi:SIS domain-containing protein [archaeon]|nr:SIS domain-containing protein [archaeon]
MKEQIEQHIRESIKAKENLDINGIEKAANIIINAFKDNKKLLIFGNGGSAADAQHFATELAVKYKKDRHPLKAIALTTNTSLITAGANDYGYEHIFERQVEQLAEQGDVVIGISTSGNSANIVAGLKKAQELGALAIGLAGANKGKIEEYCNIIINAPSANTPIIQECHILILHLIVGIIENELFN